MKKITLLLIWLLSIQLSAQDYTKLNQLKLSAPNEAVRTSNQAINLVGKNYRLYGNHEFEKENISKIIYAPSSITNEQIEAQRSYDNCIVFDYQVFYEGKNIDLNRAGVKQYRLIKIEGKLLELYPIWKEWADPMANPEVISKKGFTDMINYDAQLEFSLSNRSGPWQIRNESSYGAKKDF